MIGTKEINRLATLPPDIPGSDDTRRRDNGAHEGRHEGNILALGSQHDEPALQARRDRLDHGQVKSERQRQSMERTAGIFQSRAQCIKTSIWTAQHSAGAVETGNLDAKSSYGFFSSLSVPKTINIPCVSGVRFFSRRAARWPQDVPTAS